MYYKKTQHSNTNLDYLATVEALKPSVACKLFLRALGYSGIIWSHDLTISQIPAITLIVVFQKSPVVNIIQVHCTAENTNKTLRMWCLKG